MAQLKKADQGLVFASCVFNPAFFSIDGLQNLWRGRYNECEKFFPAFNPLLDYYSKEMGNPLERVVVFSSESYEREELIEGKLWADEIERRFAQNGSRVVNIDVGMLFKEQALLSTSKPYSHRIYLRNGVWAELVYTYENKSYHFLPWTYPDYRHEEKISFFNTLRLRLFSKDKK